jgi:hypothetical protein
MRTASSAQQQSPTAQKSVDDYQGSKPSTTASNFRTKISLKSMAALAKQSPQFSKIQQQTKFNIVLANKKQLLQKKYMELIREKD